MKDTEQLVERKVDLGRCGSVTMHLSEDRRHLLVSFAIQAKGFDKTGVNGFIGELEKIRDKMER